MVDLNPDEAVEPPVDDPSHRVERAADDIDDLEEGADGEDAAPRGTTPGLTSGLAAFCIGGLGVVLAIAYFPLLFNKFARYDDEGFFLTSIQAFLKHGSLYAHTRSAYGPFYYSVIGLVYRLTGQHPTAFNARVLVLAMTTLSGCMFAAAVFRVTRSLAFATVCQVTSFITLVRVAGNEPLHPGSMIVLLVSVLTYALASYAVEARTALIVVAGATVGAIAMCKINVGVLATVALVMAWTIGNRRIARPLRTLVVVAVGVFPFLLMTQRLYAVAFAEFAAIVALALLATAAVLEVDSVTLPIRPLVTAAAAAITTVVLSVIWPFLHGTSPIALVKGVAITPLQQVDILTIPPILALSWVPIVLTLAGTYFALVRDRDDETPTLFGNAVLPTVLLTLAAAWVIGLGAGANFATWLPVIALLNALAWTSAAPPTTRLVLRFLVPIAILQSLHAYPVAGSQFAWATAAIFAPATIALAAGLERLPAWPRIGATARGLGAGALCLVFALLLGLWPIAAWRNYRNSTPLGLRGTSLVRVTAVQARTLQQVTKIVKRDCDTFYSAPGLDSLYVFTDIDPPTGLLSNHTGALTTSQQREVVSQLSALREAGKRVCIVRDTSQIKAWTDSSYGRGPLGQGLAPYATVIGRAGTFTVSVEK